VLNNYHYTEENEIFKNLKYGRPHCILVKYRYLTVKSEKQQLELSITMYKFYVAALIRYYYCFMYPYFDGTYYSDISDVTEASKHEILTSKNDKINIKVLCNTHIDLFDVQTLYGNREYIEDVFLYKQRYYRYYLYYKNQYYKLTEKQKKNFLYERDTTLDKPDTNHLNINIIVYVASGSKYVNIEETNIIQERKFENFNRLASFFGNTVKYSVINPIKLSGMLIYAIITLTVFEFSSRKNKIPGLGQYGGKSITHKRKNKRIRKTNRNIKNKTHKSNSINKKRRTCKK